MARDDELRKAKAAYRSAASEGNRQEEAKWANFIAYNLKDRGEYVEALKWLRIDYEISEKYLSQRQCLTTCQSLGEVYLLLRDFEHALLYQKKHLDLAKDMDDLLEQQRASTQLGRTYLEMSEKSDDHQLIRNAKKYFKSAMKLAEILKNNPPTKGSNFLKEYIDAHNNMGVLEKELDNLKGAQENLLKGLKICDEEEVIQDDACRSRLHHQLGLVYMELRMWDDAREHMEKDIMICKRIEHRLGEAKGFINLGNLHFKVHKYDEAVNCYEKALKLAKSMEDEDDLVEEINQNIKTVKEAKNVMDEIKTDEQNFKKLARDTTNARGTSEERKSLLQQYASLGCLIDKARSISEWSKVNTFGKEKKRVANELCDKEKLSDSFLDVGESYEKLRNFRKAKKWYEKSWQTYKLIGNQEGMAMAKINIGNVLDNEGEYEQALDAYEESYKIAVEANLPPSQQLSALESMHYSHMMRFDNVEESRRLENLKEKLKFKNSKLEKQEEITEDRCSETDTERNIHASDDRSNASSSSHTTKSNPSKLKSLGSVEEMDDDEPLISLLQSSRRSPKRKPTCIGKQDECVAVSPKSLSKTTSNQKTVVGRKRVRVVLSDDEDEMYVAEERSEGRIRSYPVEDVATSAEFENRHNKICSLVDIEESSGSYKTTGLHVNSQNCTGFRSSSTNEVAIAPGFAASSSENLLHKHSAACLKLHNSNDENNQCITIKIDKELIHVEAHSFTATDKLSIESVKVELACLYYLQLPAEKRSEGLFPIIQLIKCGDTVIESLETIDTLKDQMGKVLVEAFVDGWVQKRLIKLYIDGCKEVSETPNLKLLKKLYDLEVSDDEVTVSECELQDLSVTPLLNALRSHKTFAMLDLSHNLLGNATMEKLQQVFTSSGQKYGGLTLDLHCNRFGPTALLQICECPLLFPRLEVLNISRNPLTDNCASFLSTILKNCNALYYLNIERCSITSRTIQKVADALDAGSVLEQLFIGHNNPISGNAILSLLAKLSNLKRFSKLSLNGLKLSKPVIDSLCQLVKTSSLSALMLGETGIGTEGALHVTECFLNGNEESVKLDFSYCGLTSQYILKLNADASLISCILELNLAGNPIMPEGSNAVSSLLLNPQCCLKLLVLQKCQLGASGILQILQALAGNNSLEELYLADNADIDQHSPQQDITTKGSSELSQPNTNIPESPSKVCVPEEVELCKVNSDCNDLEVADSEDDGPMRVEAVANAGINGSSASSCQRNSSSSECQFIQEVSSAIRKAKKLQLLDLSINGFSTQAAELLYTAWSSSRACPAYRHFKKQTIHLLTEGKKCCVKPCCKKG